MNVAMPYFVFMEAMESYLIHGGSTSHVWNSCCLHHFTVLSAKVRMNHVYRSFRQNSMIALCCRSFLLCFTMHLMDRIDVIVSCMIFGAPMCFLKPLN